MSKTKNIFSCSKCGAQSPKWVGRCSECGSWGTMKEEEVEINAANESTKPVIPAAMLDLRSLERGQMVRIKTGWEEIDRVLGGGLARGSLLLLGGEPGVGKSTLAAQVADLIARNLPSGEFVVYASGEESASQVADRLLRLNCDLSRIKFVGETNVEKICSLARQSKPTLLLIDSIQTVRSEEAISEAGSVGQIRTATAKFLELAKIDGVTVILIGHITKDGQLAGPKTLEHMVDVVAYLEAENARGYRLLRSSKNRFGSVNEIGVLEMKQSGFMEMKDPALIFMDEQNLSFPGSVISCVNEGSRSFLVEIQALVSKTIFGYPQRKASGFDLNRLQVLSAVLSKRTNLNLAVQDIVLNVVGGLKISDPALDLAVCLAIASSSLNKSLSRQTLVLGEIGLGGEVRPVARLEQRLKEAEKLGFVDAILPKSAKVKSKLRMNAVASVVEAVKLL